MTVEERIESKVTKDSSGCWLWTGYIDKTNGYGCITIKRKTKKVHRVSWELVNGSIPKGMCICHHCDVRNCINPKHLFLGTHADNRKDCVKKGRHYKAEEQEFRIICKHGHFYDEKNTRHSIENGRKRRRCRKCHRLKEAQYRAKRKLNG